jgi:glycosyltransferase involved in cell wall biosynthesis
MRVLHVIDSIRPTNGGTATSVLQASSLLMGHGHEVEIAALSDSHGDPWVREASAPIHCFGPAYLHYAYSPRFAPWLREHAPRYDLVVIRGLWQYQSVATARVMWSLDRPYAIFIHGMLGPYSRQERLKYLKKYLYWNVIESRVVRRAAAAIFTSSEEERLAREFFPRFEWNPVVIGNSVDPPPPPSSDSIAGFVQRHPELKDKSCVVFLGRIHPIKGCETLIEAFAHTFRDDEDMHLVIAGPVIVPEYHARLHQLSRDLGIERRITWPGLLASDDRSALFSLTSVFVSPSHHENFGFAAVEALAFGLPVILTDKVNIHGVLREAQAALVCHDSVDGIERALRTWRGMGRADLDALRNRQLSTWKRQFSRESVGHRLEQSFSYLAGGTQCQASSAS